jgi:hypothetical protein
MAKVNHQPTQDPLPPSSYGEQYYTASNYAGYLERSERYERMVQELEYELFRILKLDFKHSPVIDYGCGVGFVVKAFQKLGYTNAWGYDVSDWAIKWGHQHLALELHRSFDVYAGFWPTQHDLSFIPCKNWSLMTAFDVFEHMTHAQIYGTLCKFNPRHILVRIPITNEDGGKFVLSVSEADPTHITRLTRESWHKVFAEGDYRFLFNVNLGNIYDSDGVMCAMFRRDD